MSDAIYSPGLEGIIAGETAVGTVNEGLLYRGYAVEDLAEHATFEEVAYLLLVGRSAQGRRTSAISDSGLRGRRRAGRDHCGAD